MMPMGARPLFLATPWLRCVQTPLPTRAHAGAVLAAPNSGEFLFGSLEVLLSFAQCDFAVFLKSRGAALDFARDLLIDADALSSGGW